MTLQEVFALIDTFSDDEVRAIREYIEQRNLEKWLSAFNQAVEALQEGLTEEEVSEIVSAINTETIHPVDYKSFQNHQPGRDWFSPLSGTERGRG